MEMWTIGVMAWRDVLPGGRFYSGGAVRNGRRLNTKAAKEAKCCRRGSVFHSHVRGVAGAPPSTVFDTWRSRSPNSRSPTLRTRETVSNRGN